MLEGTNPDENSSTKVTLVPRSGEYPLEQTTFSTFVMDQLKSDADAKKKANPLISLESATFDLTGEITAPTAPQIATGVHLTYRQSWQTEGVALGQLLHSLSLAPGEVVRIAVQDWSRRSHASTTEVKAESETLDNSTIHNRSISEVTQSLVREAQSGFSNFSSQSYSQSSGSSSGGGFFGFFGGGSSNSSASNYTNAVGFSASSGRRDLAASMNQNIQDRTQQLASAARNRQSVLIKEIGEDEKEIATTRVVANYNHMHTLNVQYYEMVQIYKTTLELVSIDKCLFLPVKTLNFADPNLYNGNTGRRLEKHIREVALSPELKLDAQTLILPHVENDIEWSTDPNHKTETSYQYFANYYRTYLKDYKLQNPIIGFSSDWNHIKEKQLILQFSGKSRIKAIKFFDGIVDIETAVNKFSKLSNYDEIKLGNGNELGFMQPSDQFPYGLYFNTRDQKSMKNILCK